MPLWRRRDETLNEKLAREAGLSLSGDASEPARERDRRPPEEDELADLFRRARGVLSDIAAVHGPHRHREWDAVATIRLAGFDGERVHFVALADGDLVVDEDVSDEALDALAAGVEASLEPPYRAEAVRRGEDTWAVGARRIEIVELPPDLEGDELEIAVHEGEQTLTVDGTPSNISLPALEQLLGDRHPEYVARAMRLDGRRWEVDVFPL